MMLGGGKRAACLIDEENACLLGPAKAQGPGAQGDQESIKFPVAPFVGLLSLKGNPYPKKERRAPLGNRDEGAK